MSARSTWLSGGQSQSSSCCPTPSPHHTNNLLWNWTNSISSRSGIGSPCPSPTPLFQQLYAAVSHWERVLASESPDCPTTVCRQQIVDHLERLSPIGKMSYTSDVMSVGGGGSGGGCDDDDEEGSNDTASPMHHRNHHRVLTLQHSSTTYSSSGDTKDR